MKTSARCLVCGEETDETRHVKVADGSDDPAADLPGLPRYRLVPCHLRPRCAAFVQAAHEGRYTPHEGFAA